MRQFALAYWNVTFLKDLQNHGVYVLPFDFKENNGQFLTVLNKRIRKRNEEYDIYSHQLPKELKESFFDELYSEAYRTQEFPLPLSFRRKAGIQHLSEADAELFHVQNGERLTVNQPEKYDRCIYLYGPCVILGLYVSDQYTISSLLQSELNRAGFSCRVVNRGFPNADGGHLDVNRLQSESFKRGDIVALDLEGSLVKNVPIVNLTDALEKYDAPADWFVDSVRHCNHKANQVYAHAIYEELIPVLQQPPEGREPVELDNDYIDLFYLRHYFSDFITPANK